MAVAFLLASIPAWICWVLADGAQRGVFRFPPAVLAGVRATYLAMVAAPFAFVIAFALLVLRASLLEGHWPQAGHMSDRSFPDMVLASPHPASMPIHTWIVLALFLLSLASIVGVPALWPILRVVKNEPMKRILRWFLPGLLVLGLLWLSNPGSILDWFFGTVLD